MAITCIIIDDEPLAIEQLTEYINDIPALKLIKSFSNPTIALQEIMEMKNPIDILFTDIEMPELSGLELANKIRHKTKFLILVSGHPQYAVDGYKVKANAFLTKPFSFNKFKDQVLSVVEQLQPERPFIFVKTKENKETVKIQLEEILYVEAAGNYIIIHTNEKSITTLLKISEIEEKLKDHSYFIRIHKSFLISTKHIEKFKSDFIYLKNGLSLSIGTNYRGHLKEYLSLM